MSIQLSGESDAKNGIEMYMRSDGIHTDYIFPVKTKTIDWRTIFLPEETRGKTGNYRYIAIGWGDQGFFLNTPKWSDLKASTAFDACFYRGKTAIHINYMKKLDVKFKHKKIRITKKQYRKLIKYVKQTLRVDKNQRIICIKNRGYWDSDSFYEANGSYGMFCTCNTWINKGLKESDLPACLWSPFNGGIFHKYR